MIGDNIRKRREELNLTQEEVVKKMQEYNKNIVEKVGSKDLEKHLGSFTQAQLSNWENNKSKPSLSNLNDLCIILETNLVKLCGDKLSDSKEKFFKEGYHLGVTIKGDISAKILELQNILKAKNINDLRGFFLEMYLIGDIGIPESTGEIFRDALYHNDDKDTIDNFVMCMISFEMGLHNGNLAKLKNKKLDKK